MTFALYKQQEGGAPVWQEVQNVTLSAGGRYTVLLGSASSTGLSPDLFSPQEQRWLGVQVEGFPNMFMLMGPHTALGNIPRSIEYNVDWVTGLVKHMHDHGRSRVEPQTEAVDDWATHVSDTAAGLLFSQVNSWQTGVNRNVEGR